MKTHYKDYEDKISNLQWVGKHSFYPFIHCELDKSKFTNDKKVKPKYREIYYSAHVDSYIYQYYGNELNNMYNSYAKRSGINNVATAYRNCWKGKCNIHFAKEVFEFVASKNAAYIFVADLSNFFDTLDFKYLKQQIKTVMGVDSLDKAHYSIYKSLTHFSYVDYEDIEKIKKLPRKKLKDLDRLFEIEDFRESRGELVKTNSKGKGIPQGSSISAVYANTYMINFDRILNEYVTSRQGLYRRYCDDIIVVIPIDERDVSSNCDEIYTYIMKLQDDIPNIEINPDKTNQFIYYNSEIATVGELKKAEVSYLGFNFDGKSVRIRDKSIFKFYCRAYRKIEQVNTYLENGEKNKYIAGKKAIYNNYTHLFNPKRAKKKNAKYGNFITYAYRAHKVFSDSTIIDSKIKLQLRRHWSKIDGKINR